MKVLILHDTGRLPHMTYPVSHCTIEWKFQQPKTNLKSQNEELKVKEYGLYSFFVII